MNKVVLAAFLVLATFNAQAVLVAQGVVESVSVGKDNIAVLIKANSDSPCGSGYFYSYDSDSSIVSVNRFLSVLLSAEARGATVAIYNPTADCSHNTTSRFVALKIEQ